MICKCDIFLNNNEIHNCKYDNKNYMKQYIKEMNEMYEIERLYRIKKIDNALDNNNLLEYKRLSKELKKLILDWNNKIIIN